jgi:hypothetical protein
VEWTDGMERMHRIDVNYESVSAWSCWRKSLFWHLKFASRSQQQRKSKKTNKNLNRSGTDWAGFDWWNQYSLLWCELQKCQRLKQVLLNCWWRYKLNNQGEQVIDLLENESKQFLRNH